MTNPIQIERDEDGTYTLTYFGKVVGWIQRDRGVRLWRALTVHGDVIHRSNLDGARAALLEAYH